MRKLRGMEIVSKGKQITQNSQTQYTVHSQHGKHSYNVKGSCDKWTCDCPDYLKRKDMCKHIFAVQFLLSLPSLANENLAPPKYSAHLVKTVKSPLNLSYIA